MFWRLSLFLLFFAKVPLAFSAPGQDPIYRQDFPEVPKLIFDAKVDPSQRPAQEKVESYLQEHLARYARDLSPKDFELSKIRHSLLGSHYYYQQSAVGFEVVQAELIISLARDGETIYQVFNNVYPRIINRVEEELISEDKAYEIAWADLRGHGALRTAPEAKLAFHIYKGRPVLAYSIKLDVEEPYGVWSYAIDAVSGKVLSREDLRIYRKKRPPVDLTAYKGPVWDFKVTWRAFNKSNKEKRAPVKSMRANAKGLTFDPDPRTSLNDNSLSDTSPAEAFDEAYFEVELLDVTFDGEKYSLNGPWVNIVDFDRPTTAPSTSTTGVWQAKRGNNAFNDAMTYYHIDKSQRYIQSLGFKDDAGIQFGSIAVDTDGVNGTDNSYFQPANNRLAFGHGCVDDNEDADVILHEYGHAIQHSINNNWGGGDTGAMGEGFGDYWAGSYSLRTPNGAEFFPNFVFTWDAHGEGNECWDGRILDATDARYNPNETYTAHSNIDGGFSSDELWSTPLFQTLLAAREEGIAHEEIDQIVLESHFGIGVGLSMRELATVTIATAARLQIGGRHAELFTESFLQMNIVEVPAAQLTPKEVIVTGTGGNNVPDPGEEIALNVVVLNDGTLAAQGISAQLTSLSAGVSVLAGEAHYPDLAIGSEGVNDSAFRIKLAGDFPCGDKVQLELKLTYNGQNKVIPLHLGTGVPQIITVNAAPDRAIPDGDQNGITETLEVTEEGVVSEEFSVPVEIRHTFIGDLVVTIESPNGTQVMLHNRSGHSNDNLIGIYPTTLTPAEDLKKLAGEPLKGTWKLLVKDLLNADDGVLKSWGVSNIMGYQCQ